MMHLPLHCAKALSSKCDQISRKLRIWSHLRTRFLMENFIFCAVLFPADYCRSVSTSQISQISTTLQEGFTSQKIKFSIQDFFSKCDKIRSPLWIWEKISISLIASWITTLQYFYLVSYNFEVVYHWITGHFVTATPLNFAWQ